MNTTMKFGIITMAATLAAAGVVYTAAKVAAVYTTKEKEKIRKEIEEAAVTAASISEDFDEVVDLHNHFIKIFNNSAVSTAEFNPSWKNGTGYFDGLSKTIEDWSSVSKTVDDHGRKILIVPSEKSLFVVFERYTNKQRIVTHTFNYDGSTTYIQKGIKEILELASSQL